MAKYDAFGREIGENTLAGLGAEPVATPTPVPVAPPAGPAASGASQQAATPQVTARPKFRRAKRGSGSRAARTVVFLIVMTGVGIQALVDNSTPDSTSTTAVPNVAAPPATGGTPAGPSLIRTDSLGSAIATLRSANLGQISYLRIQPDRLDAQMVKGNKLRQVQVTPDFKLRTLATSTGSGAGDEFGFSVIRPNAPTRLIRSASAKLDHRRSDVNYLVFSRFGDELQWALFFKNGDLATGDVYGRLKRY